MTLRGCGGHTSTPAPPWNKYGGGEYTLFKPNNTVGIDRYIEQGPHNFGPGKATYIVPFLSPDSNSFTVGLVTVNQGEAVLDLETKALFTIKKTIYLEMQTLCNKIAKVMIGNQPTPEKVLNFTDTFQLIRQPYTIQKRHGEVPCWILYAAPVAEH